MQQLSMIHPDSFSAQPAVAPKGYILRSYQPGDEAAWAQIVNTTDMNWPDKGRGYDVCSVRSLLTETPQFDPAGLFFACQAGSGQPVATACAYRSFSHGRMRATLHMVAGLKEHAGHGLGKLVCQAVLNHFAQRGEKEVVLTTDDRRTPAIAVYLQLGWLPGRFHRGEDHAQRWQQLFDKLSGRCGPLRFAGTGRAMQVAIAGLRRGRHLAEFIRHHPAGAVLAGVDLKADVMEKFAADFSAKPMSWEEMLSSQADAVVVATDLPSHAALAMQAMRAGKDVLSEVTAFYHLAEGVELVETVQQTGRAYMMAENCLYSAPMLELDYQVRCGALGEMRYAEGDYVHDVRYLFLEDGQPTWRAFLPPLIYCSHPLGPILRTSKARPSRVVAMHTGSAMARTAGGLDMGSMLIQCDSGAAIRIAAGFAVSRQPSSLYVGYFGTRGSLETDRWDERVHLFEEKSRHALGPVSYRPTGRDHRGYTTEGHCGADPRTVECWLESLANGLSMPSDVYQAADMTTPGILGHRSSVSGNVPIDIPDFRDEAARDACRADRLIADPADMTRLRQAD